VNTIASTFFMLVSKEHVFSIMTAFSNAAFLVVNICKLAGAMEVAVCLSSTQGHMR